MEAMEQTPRNQPQQPDDQQPTLPRIDVGSSAPTPADPQPAAPPSPEAEQAAAPRAARGSFASRLGARRYGWRSLLVSTVAALALGGAAGAGIHALASDPGPGDWPGGPAMNQGPGERFEHPGPGRWRDQTPPGVDRGERQEQRRDDERQDRDDSGPSASPSPDGEAGASVSPGQARA